MEETDVFIYNGQIHRREDLDFINYVSENQEYQKCLLILVTPGGDPDAAYKIARYLQSKYESLSILISGECKSAGTLLALGAEKLIFAPYGELGPLDIQTVKTDQIMGLESGLNITQAFSTLEERAKNTYYDLTVEIIKRSGGVISYQSASKAATDIVSALHGPIFKGIDPEELGKRTRAMRIGRDYGLRLNLKWENLKENALDTFVESYASHSFVIDFEEAKGLFKNVSLANEEEMKLVHSFGNSARFSGHRTVYLKLPTEGKGDEKNENQEIRENRTNSTENDGRNSKKASSKKKSNTNNKGRLASSKA